MYNKHPVCFQLIWEFAEFVIVQVCRQMVCGDHLGDHLILFEIEQTICMR